MIMDFISLTLMPERVPNAVAMESARLCWLYILTSYEIYTFRISAAVKISAVVGSFTRPGSTPTFALISRSRSRPYTLPFGSTTGSFST